MLLPRTRDRANGAKVEPRLPKAAEENVERFGPQRRARMGDLRVCGSADGRTPPLVPYAGRISSKEREISAATCLVFATAGSSGSTTIATAETLWVLRSRPR